MNNPNPFVPKGSLLEQQSKRRSRLKLGVFCVLAVGIAGLAAMLIQGCKREEDQNQTETDNNPPAVDTNSPAVDTNAPSMEASNPPVSSAPPGPSTPPSTVPNVAPAPPAPVTPAAPAPTEGEYVVVKGDTFSKIAKENGTTVKAIEDANPGVTPTRLKVGEKLVIPAGASTTGGTAAGETANGVATANGGDEVYLVKSGDTLSHIAHRHGVTVKALEAENNLTTTKIKVGQKLNIPAAAEAPAAPQNAPPATTTAPEPAPAAPASPANSQPPSNPPGAAPQQ